LSLSLSILFSLLLFLSQFLKLFPLFFISFSPLSFHFFDSFLLLKKSLTLFSLNSSEVLLELSLFLGGLFFFLSYCLFDLQVVKPGKLNFFLLLLLGKLKDFLLESILLLHHLFYVFTEEGIIIDSEV
jgi:hypothetical protein